MRQAFTLEGGALCSPSQIDQSSSERIGSIRSVGRVAMILFAGAVTAARDQWLWKALNIKILPYKRKTSSFAAVSYRGFIAIEPGRTERARYFVTSSANSERGGLHSEACLRYPSAFAPRRPGASKGGSGKNGHTRCTAPRFPCVHDARHTARPGRLSSARPLPPQLFAEQARYRSAIDGLRPRLLRSLFVLFKFYEQIEVKARAFQPNEFSGAT